MKQHIFLLSEHITELLEATELYKKRHFLKLKTLRLCKTKVWSLIVFTQKSVV